MALMGAAMELQEMSMGTAFAVGAPAVALGGLCLFLINGYVIEQRRRRSPLPPLPGTAFFLVVSIVIMNKRVKFPWLLSIYVGVKTSQTFNQPIKRKRKKKTEPSSFIKRVFINEPSLYEQAVVYLSRPDPSFRVSSSAPLLHKPNSSSLGSITAKPFFAPYWLDHLFDTI